VSEKHNLFIAMEELFQELLQEYKGVISELIKKLPEFIDCLEPKEKVGAVARIIEHFKTVAQ
jgi:hypothetical protein